MTICPCWWTRQTVSTGISRDQGTQPFPRKASNDAQWQRSPPRGPADSIRELPKGKRRPMIVGK